MPAGPVVDLPTYAFDRQRYWLTREPATADVTGAGLAVVDHGLLTAALDIGGTGALVLSGRLSAAVQPWLSDHGVDRATILPMSGFAELVMRAGDEVGCARVDELTVQTPLRLDPRKPVDVQVLVEAADAAGRRPVAVFARSGVEQVWTRHAQGVIRPGVQMREEAAADPAFAALAAWPPEGADLLPDPYAELAARGYRFGPAFQGLRAAWRRGDEMFAEVALPEAARADLDQYTLHPALLDAAAHALLLDGGEALRLPSAAAGVTVFASGADHVRVHLRWEGRDAARMALADGAGQPVAVIEALQLTTPALGTTPAEDALFGLTWLPATIDAKSDARWAVIGDGRSGIPTPAEAEQHADLAAFLAALRAESTDAGVVLLPVAADGIGDVAHQAREVAGRLLAALRTWLADEHAERCRLIVLTSAADLAASVVWGLVRTAQTEHPGRLTLIDLDPDASGEPDWPQLLATTEEPQLAVRGDRVLVPRLTVAAETDEPAATFGADGTVLVTGGTGLVGAHVARHLVAADGVRHLVLLSRRGAEAPGAAALRDELTGLGAQVTVVACDVTDRAALAEVLGAIPADRPLTAVVHAAGVTDNEMLTAMTVDQLDSVLGARVIGAMNLHELTRDHDLSAFVLFSSAAGVLGPPGHANLAAASAFLDALAQHRHAAGQPALGIAWGAWASDDAGRLDDADRARLAREGAVAVTPADGLALFDRARRTRQGLVVATPIDLAALRARAAAGVLSPLWRNLVTAPVGRPSAEGGEPGSALAQQLIGVPEGEQGGVILELVRGHVAAVLGYESSALIDPDRGFLDSGFDSLTAVELRNRLIVSTGLRLSVTLIFDHPTPAELAAHLESQVRHTRPSTAPARTTPIARNEPIAIVGMACRLPGGVSTPEQLWDLVTEGRDATCDFPTDRGWPDDLFDPDPEAVGRTYVRRGGFLDDVAGFDAEFFGISPREALAMDPQQRLLMEVSYEVLERAGLDPGQLRGSETGVYVGAGMSFYIPDMGQVPSSVEGYTQTGNTLSVLSGRVAYNFGFEGPAITVDTACSSSLVALHLAVQALRQGECSLALAGGVTVLANPGGFVEFSRQRALSPDGRAKAFSAEADGTSWAEGVGVLALERLSDAQRLGHKVLAVVRGTATNQDGASSGLTAPNGPAQQRVIRQALANAGLSHEDVDAVEAHGTGTKLGDPIEAQALLSTYGQRPDDRPLWLGSLKSNIGHAVAAAGVAGVIKMVLALQEETLPRTLHADEPSPMIDWSAGAVSLLTEPQPWQRSAGRSRRAGVSSFGVSGTNAHVIIEEAPAAPPAAVAEPPAPLLTSSPVVTWRLSGATLDGLRAQAAQLLSLSASESDAAAVGQALFDRPALRHRLAVTAGSRAELLAGLEHYVTTGAPDANSGVGTALSRPRTVFVFPGQGWQWDGMAADLLDTCPVFAATVAEASALIEQRTGWSVVDILRQNPDAPNAGRVDVIQPVMFTVMIGLARTWMAAGIRPDAVIGHSQGEIAAAHVAGALTLEDAVHIVVTRAAAITRLDAGAMVSVSTAPEDLPEHPGLHIAAVNGPSTTIVSGDVSAAEALLEHCAGNNIHARRIPVTYASHSPHVEAIREHLQEALTGISPRSGDIPLISTLTGAVIDTAEMDCTYWYENLRQPVQFHTATSVALAAGHNTFIEISAHPVLQPAITQTTDTHPQPTATLPTLVRNIHNTSQLHKSLTHAWLTGLAPVHPCPHPHAADLPTYRFHHQRFWLSQTRTAAAEATIHPLLSAAVPVATDGSTVLSGHLSLKRHPWLADHAVAGTVLLPGTGFVELVIRAGDEVGCSHLEELVVQAPLIVDRYDGTDIQIVISPADDSGRCTAIVYSRRPADPMWTQHVEATLTAQELMREEAAPMFAAMRAWPPAAAEQIPIDDLYRSLEERGYGYGPTFQGLRAVWRRDGDVYAEIALPEDVQETAAGFGLHPAILDAAAHAIPFGGFLPAEGVWLPFSWTGVTLYAAGADRVRVRLSQGDGPDSVRMLVADASGAPVATIDAMRARPVDPAALRSGGADEVDSLLTVSWSPVAPAAAPAGTSPAVLGTLPGLPASFRQHADLDALIAAVEAGAAAPTDVLLPVSGGAGEMVASAIDIATGLLATVQRWLACEALASSRLVVVTRGAIGVTGGAEDLGASVVWGMMRTAQTEEPDRFVLCDLDPAGSAVDWPALIGASQTEPQLAVRDGNLVAPRLVHAARVGDRIAGTSGFGAGTDWRIGATGGGSIESVGRIPNPLATQPLEPGQVRIGVRAAGLNFFDIATALGLVDMADGMGAEGAGVITEVGPEVTGWQVGDRVLGAFPNAFAPLTIADARMITTIPDGWSYTEAASVPAAFLTACYALHDLAGVQPGENVLIHAATGGVGMAAVQLATHLGATVYATASPAKWPVLREMGIPEERIASSRSIDFAAAFPAMDVVLGSLSGELVDASIGLLKPGGRYREMGKTDIRDAADHPAISYQAFDLKEAGPVRIGEMLRHLVDLLTRGELHTLPARVWSLADLRHALRHMSQARHTGKNVIEIPVPVDPNGTTVITGGTGTIGALIAGHLAEQGHARRLLLLSRRGPDAAGADELHARLTELGAKVTITACDTSDPESLTGVLDAIPAEYPLTAVIHAVGVLQDATITTLTRQQMVDVLTTKIAGAATLHRYTQDRELGAFVLFSSAGSILGSPGQANYTAANTFLDALATHRRPATSIAWGLWAQASGMTAHLSQADITRMNRTAISPMATPHGLELFDHSHQMPHALQLAAPLNTAYIPDHPIFALLRPTTGRHRPTAGTGAANAADLAGQLAQLTGEQQRQHLLQLVQSHTAAVLAQANPAAIGAHQGFLDQGLDSLTAIELRNRLNTATGLRLPATTIFDHPTPHALTEHLIAKLAPASSSSSTAPDAEPGEVEIRALLAGIPLAQLKDAGLMRPLMRLAGVADAETDEEDDDLIDTLSVEDLVQAALGDVS
ncbi:SDR family NAD(P)-dependent oxidoreductase [Micromonospora sp. NPDC051196]|uniref:SDR family NAD(P)-dependent oxidoreductase n=1 Tax=Micromonospora sp. NPDC051196 TaxID=3155281 RepID=UPI00342C08CC